MEKVDNDTLENLVKYIYKYNNTVIDKLSIVDLCFANELNSVNYTYSLHKLLSITENDYKDFHYCINNFYYEIYMYIDLEPNLDNLYQMISCNNYTQIWKFKQNEYDKKILVSEFKNPGKIYSFFDGTVIIIESDKKMNLDYQYINI